MTKRKVLLAVAVLWLLAAPVVAEEAKEPAPIDVKAIRAKASALLKEKKWQAAIEELGKILAANPKDAGVL